MSFAFHACAPGGEWINDPNGLIRDAAGGWRLFVQHSAVPPDFKAVGWASLTSDDLVHWSWEGQVIAPQDDGYAWSGSVRGTRELNALLTRYNPADGQQRQVATRSIDSGRSWAPDSQLHGASGANIRDPFCFVAESGIAAVLLAEPCPWTDWHAADRSLISIWRREGDALHRQGTIGPWSPPGILWEVPVLIDFGAAQVLIVSMVDQREGRAACSVRYRIGQFAGQSFVPAGEEQLLDHGPDFYAAIVDSGGAPDRYLVAWASSWASARFMSWPGGIHGGPITLPRRLTLSGDGQSLVQHPLATAPIHAQYLWELGSSFAQQYDGEGAKLTLNIDADGHVRAERHAQDERLHWRGALALTDAQTISIYRDNGLFEIFFEPLGASLTVFIPGA